MKRRSRAEDDGAGGRCPALYPVGLLTAQAASFCNLDCAYCYLPERGRRDRFDLGLLPVLFANLRASGLLEDELDWSWHVGEPLAAGEAFFAEAGPLLRACCPPGVRLRLSLQTNGTLLTGTLAALLARHGYRVGVSLDGPAFLHDAQRTTRGGRGSHAAVMRGLGRLREHGVPFSVICVLTAASLDWPREIYRFFRELEPQGLAFNVEEIEGVHARSSLAAPGTPARVAAFFREIFRLHLAAAEPFRLREWDKTAPAADAGPRVAGTTVPFDHLTVLANGDFATFAPELAPLRDAAGCRRFVLGNVRTGLIRDAVRHPGFRRLHGEVRRGVAACRRTCGDFAACGGGFVSNKLHEHGTCAAAETLACRLVEREVRRVARELRGA